MAISIPTFQAIYDAVRAEIQARNPQLNDFQTGSVLDAYTGGVGVGADEVVRYAIHRFDALFLDRATGQDLDDLIVDRFGLTRHPATSSSVAVDLARNSFVGDIDIPAGTIIEATLADGTVLEFETLTNVFHAAAATGPWADDVVISSVETGSDQNVPQTGTTWELQSISGTTLTSVSDVTITVDEDAAGGAEQESDDAYRSRAKLYYSTLVRGTAEALRTGALTVATVRYATVSEVVGGCNVDTYLYVSDASGTSNSTMTDAVEAVMPDWRATGRSVIVLGASIEYPVLSIIVKYRSGADTGELQDGIYDAIIAYFGATSPGTTVYLSAVETVIHEVSDDVLSADVYISGSPSLRELTPTNPQDTLRARTADVNVTLIEVT